MPNHINEYLLNCKIWKNIQYDFNQNGSSSNCSLNVFAGVQVIKSIQTKLLIINLIN